MSEHKQKRLPPEEEQKRVDSIAEQFNADARASHIPRENQEPQFKKRVQEVVAGQKIPGTDIHAKSNYWDFMGTTEDVRSKEVKIQEDRFANPDILSEDEEVGRRELTELGGLQMLAVQEVFAGLTLPQRRILELSYSGVWSDEEGCRVYTEQAIADELGISRDNVHVSLSRLKTKIRRRYEKLKTAQ
jgi:RNA polymerase sigma factor (sigma-70 family)